MDITKFVTTIKHTISIGLVEALLSCTKSSKSKRIMLVSLLQSLLKFGEDKEDFCRVS